jgi:hypothetical protein
MQAGSVFFRLARGMVMTDSDTEVKSGTAHKAGMIAIATALIGAATTISVAYITKSTPSEQVRPSPPAPGPDIERDVVPAPQPLMQTNRNVAGLWTASDGEQMEIVQTGSQLTMNGGVMTAAGSIIWQGYGRINDRNISWTGQFAMNGNQVEGECTGRLTSGNNSIQGMCEMLGQRAPFVYSR